MRVWSILALFAVVFTISSCNVLDRSAKITYNGVELSPADISEIGESFNDETPN